jgi:DNA mismatch repair protein MutL
MPKVRVLPDEVANNIAAGEIIERPASVVKECVENAIDADATEIIVKIQNGGRDLIQIIDNGHGMSEEDVFLAFERHATSKIRTVDDITHISTMGFRGEALPSIASVSHFNIITRAEGDELATELNFSGGKLDYMQKTAAKTGTTVSVKNIFFNVPARRKFLKTEPVEYKHILSYLHYQSVLFPQIGFALVNNNKEKFHYPATRDIYDRMLDVFGTAFTQQNFTFFSTGNHHLKFYGYIQDIEVSEQNLLLDARYLFVNRRFIYDKVIYAAIKGAYEPFLKKYRFFDSGKLPNYILFIEIAPEDIDVNVHPAKTEIRFRNINPVYQFVKDTLYETLHAREMKRYNTTREKLSSLPLISPLTPSEAIIAKEIFQQPKDDNAKQSRNPALPDVEYAQLIPTDVSRDVPEVSAVLSQTPAVAQATTPSPTIEKPERVTPAQSHEAHIILKALLQETVPLWQLHNTYIFVQVDDGFVAIDQHAAHERILYEKLLANIESKKPNKQQLVFPIVIDLPKVFSDEIMKLISQNQDTLENMGFSIKSFSGSTIVIDELPAEISYWDGGDMMIQILHQLHDELNHTCDFRIASAASVACKAAIKAGKKLSKKEMTELITDLFKCDYPLQCPHGRPLIIRVSLTEIEKMFKRIT